MLPIRGTRCVAPLVILLLMACADEEPSPLGPSDDLAPLYLAPPETAIPDEFVVILRQEFGEATARARAIALGNNSFHVLRGARGGFAGVMSADQVAALRRDPAVDWIEQNQIARATVIQLMNGNGDPWGLDRIDQSVLPLDGQFQYRRKGVGVTIYIVDTGIMATHPQFLLNGVSRAQNAFDAFGGSGSDCHGHGTHVAGTAGARTFGVAKHAQLRGVRVLDCTGTGSTISVLLGLDYVLTNFAPPTVVNMSLGFAAVVKSVNLWVDALNAAGAFPVAAAGNEDEPPSVGVPNPGYACDVSPASALGAFSVAASDQQDQKASFSNWGLCVDMYAPGVAILSAVWPSGTAIASGTSMAAPHVAGVAALVLQQDPTRTPSQVVRQLMRYALSDLVVGNDGQFWHYGTPNILLNKGGL